MDIQQKPTPRPDLIEAAERCRAEGGSWHTCVALTGLSEHTLRLALVPGYRERKIAEQRARRKPAGAPKPPRPKRVRPPQERLSCGWLYLGSGNAKPTPDALRERERAMLAPRTLTAALLGDPPAGRSALDKRGA